MTVYYNKNGHFLIHMLKYKQTVVGYDYYTDNDGNTHAVRNPAKDRYILVEDKDHKLNKQTVTYYNDKQQYQSVGGDLAVPGYDDYDDPANAGSGNDPFEEQRKTDGKDIDKIHKLNTGKSLEDLIPKKKKYKLHAEEYQKTLVSDNFTSRKIDVIKGPNGLQVIDGDKFYTGWPYKKHSTDGLNTQTMDLLYAPQNLDVYYRPQYVNNHKVDKNGLVGGGAYGKVTNFDPKKYNPADYAGYSEKWAVDNSKKLTKKQIEDDGSYSEDEANVNAINLTNAKAKTSDYKPTMFYQILVNGKMVKDNLTQDQLDKTKFTINLPDIQGYTKPQNSITASFSDPLFRTITAVYTANGQTPNNQPDNSSVSTNTPTDGQHNSGKPTDNKPDNNPDHSANNPNKSDNDDSKEPSNDHSNAKPNKSDSNDSKQPNNDHSDNNSNKSHNDDSNQPSDNHSNTNPDKSNNNDSNQPTDSHNADTNSNKSHNNDSDQTISGNANSSTNDQTSTDKNTDNSASANHNDSTASHTNSSNNANVNNSNDAAANTSVANKSNSDNQETTLSNKKASLSTDHTNNQQNATNTHWQTSNKTRQVRQLQNNRSTADQNRSNTHTPNRLTKRKQAIYAKQEASLSVTPINYTPAKQNTPSPADYQTTNMHMAIASPTLSVNTVGQYLNKANVLPQTGTANNQTNLAIAAIGLAIVVASTSLMIDRRKRN